MSGAHARRYPVRPWMVLAGVMLLGLLSLFLGPAPRAGAVTVPSSDACHTTNNATPRGDCGPFKQVFWDSFNGRTVKVGSFSGCDHNVDTPAAYCSGLSGVDRSNWWAYPRGWFDTAQTGADGNGGAPFGGEYRADDTVSIVPTSATNSDGVLRVRMYRPAGSGLVHSAAVVPKKCMAHKYGKYTERFRVSHLSPGFKSAHLFYEGGQEIDFPEGDWGKDISGFVHPQETSVSRNVSWTTAHTTSIEWVPGKVRMYLDGKLIKTSSTAMPTASWVLQNESSIEGPYAARGTSATLDTTWVSCYVYRP